MLRVEHGGRGGLGVAMLDRSPDGREIPDVGFEIGFADAVTGCANDETEIFRSQAFDDLSQPPSLFVRSDAAGHADAARPRREHQVTSGNRNAGCDARALGANRLLGDLNDDLLAFAEHRVDARRSRASTAASTTTAFSAAARGFAIGLASGEGAFEVVAYVKKRCLLKADVDEGCLHAGKHATNLPLHDVSYDALVSISFDVQFSELLVF